MFSCRTAFKIQEIRKIDAFLLAARPTLVYVMEIRLPGVVLAGSCGKKPEMITSNSIFLFLTKISYVSDAPSPTVVVGLRIERLATASVIARQHFAGEISGKQQQQSESR